MLGEIQYLSLASFCPSHLVPWQLCVSPSPPAEKSILPGPWNCSGWGRKLVPTDASRPLSSDLPSTLHVFYGCPHPSSTLKIASFPAFSEDFTISIRTLLSTPFLLVSWVTLAIPVPSHSLCFLVPCPLSPPTFRELEKTETQPWEAGTMTLVPKEQKTCGKLYRTLFYPSISSRV